MGILVDCGGLSDGSIRLEGTFPGNDMLDRTEDDLDIEGQRLMPHVIDVFGNRLLKGQQTSPLRLCQAGQTLLYLELLQLPGLVVFHHLGDVGPRPDECHVADQDIDEVGSGIHGGV